MFNYLFNKKQKKNQGLKTLSRNKNQTMLIGCAKNELFKYVKIVEDREYLSFSTQLGAVLNEIITLIIMVTFLNKYMKIML